MERRRVQLSDSRRCQIRTGVKRTALKRRVSLRDSYLRKCRERGIRQPKMRANRLRRISKEKKNWRDIYILCLRFLIGLDPICRRCRERYANSGHHPFGQHGALILLFFPMCMVCHNEVECSKNKARDEGWILYPIRLSGDG